MARLNLFQASPDAVKALLAPSALVNNSGLDPKTLELVKLRTSQLNGCAYCIDMHTKDARSIGETEQRLYLVSAWREAHALYSEQERAALAWTEAVVRLVNSQIPDEVYEEARKSFTEKELANLTLAITTTAAWNRMNIAFHVAVGSYRPGQFKDLKLA